MEWYYASGGQRNGPISEEQLGQFVQSGQITPETLVWAQGMENWQPYREVAPPQPPAPGFEPNPPATASPVAGAGGAESPFSSPQGPGPAPGAAPFGGAVAAGAPCCECGRLFPPEQMIPFQGRFVCPGCKPFFFQKVREGAGFVGMMEYGGFWIRAGAKLLDWLISGTVMAIIFGVAIALVVVSSGGDGPGPGGILFLVVAYLFGFGLYVAYNTYFIGRYAATPGKMACGLLVVRPDGSKVTYMRALGRFFAEMITQNTFYIGYIICAFDDEGRTLHDHICSTRVIKK